MSPYGNTLHIVGVAGTEGAALLDYLSNTYPKVKITAHDYSEKKSFLKHFKEAHIGMGREAAVEKGKELLALENVTFCFRDEYLNGIENAETIFVPQSWHLYEQNKNLKPYRDRFRSITRLYFDLFPGKIIGVTGSNGKTTTSNLIAEVMKEAYPRTLFSGNDRRASQVLEDMAEAHSEDWLVLEISNRQLMIDLGKSPDIGIITNITPNHLNEYKDFEEYAAGKASMLQHQREGQWAMLNADDPQSQKLMEIHEGEVFPFSTEQQLSHGVFVQFGKIMIKHADRVEEVMEVADFPLKGKHNLSNALATIGACYLAGVPLEAIATVLRSVEPIAQRLELVDTVGGVEYYNDSASTVPESTLAAVDALKQEGRKIILIAGGKSKGSDYAQFAKNVSPRIDALVIIESPIADIIRDMKDDSLTCEKVPTLQEAVEWCKKNTKPGDVVLFSPAAEYFSYFRDLMPGYKNFRHMVASLNTSA